MHSLTPWWPMEVREREPFAFWSGPFVLATAGGVVGCVREREELVLNYQSKVQWTLHSAAPLFAFCALCMPKYKRRRRRRRAGGQSGGRGPANGQWPVRFKLGNAERWVSDGLVESTCTGRIICPLKYRKLIIIALCCCKLLNKKF